MSRRRVNTAPRTAPMTNRAPPTSSSPVSSTSCTSASAGDVGRVDGLGPDGYPVVVDREEPAVDHGRVGLARRGLDLHVAADQDAQQGGVTRQDPHLALDGASGDLLGFALPDLAVCGDELNLQLTHGFLRSRTCTPSLTGNRG